MAQKTPKTDRVLRGVLVASLALNLAIGGVVAGAYLSGGPKGGPQRFDLSAGPLIRAMDSDSRAALRATLRDRGALQLRDRRAIRQDMDVLLGTLRADTFDEAAFRAALIRQRSRLEAGQDAVLDAVTAQISAMNSADRAAFAERLQTQLRRGGPRDN